MMVSYFGILLLLLIGVGVVVVVVVAIAMSARGKRISTPSCGSCGYAVEGLESLRCPECGSDLRAVGIVTPAHGRGVPRIVWAVLYTILLPIPALILSGILAITIPPRYHYTTSATLLQPNSRTFSSIVLSATGERTRRGINGAEEVRLKLIPNDGRNVPQLTYDSIDGEIIVDRNGGQSLGSLSTTSIKEWMAMSGIDVEQSGVDQELNEIVRTIRVLETGGTGFSTGSFAGVSSSSGGSSQPRTWLTVTMSIFWLIVWLGGLWLLLRPRKRAADGTT